MAPREPSSAASTTLYRLTDLDHLRDAIREKYLDDDAFEDRDCMVGDREAVLVLGHIATQRAKWADRLANLTGDGVDARNETAAAVLLIPGSPGVTWAVTFGMGFLLLDQTQVDPGFGQRVAIRVADTEKLNSLTRKTMDSRAKVDRASIPSGEHLRGFGLGGFGELVTRLVAAAEIPGLTVRRPIKLRGADALSVPLGRAPKDLLADLDAIEQALTQPALEELQILEQLVAVKKGTQRADALDAVLEKALTHRDAAVAAAWPHESVNENGTPESFIVKGRGKREPKPGVPSTSDLWAAVDPTNVLGSLDRVKIQLFNDPDGDNAISPDIPLRKWIAFEQDLDGNRYFLHDGGWYLMDSDYADQLRDRVQQIFDRKWDRSLPPWPPNTDEKTWHEEAYNKLAGAETGGVVLDRKLIHTKQNSRGFEACDILMPDGALVHVKNIDSSSPASHLFAQGHNSASILASDSEARAKLRTRVEANGGSPSLVKSKPPAIVFGIARRSGKPFTAQTLYSFSQVTLVRTVDDLESRGISVYVVAIPNGSESNSKSHVEPAD
jgi:uncharacterized protein (TIGR04141 family)